MSVNLAQAQAILQAYITAETEVLLGKTVRLGGPGLDREVRLEDLPAIRSGRQEWERRVASLMAAGSGAHRGIGGLSVSVADFSREY